VLHIDWATIYLVNWTFGLTSVLGAAAVTSQKPQARHSGNCPLRVRLILAQLVAAVPFGFHLWLAFVLGFELGIPSTKKSQHSHTQVALWEFVGDICASNCFLQHHSAFAVDICGSEVFTDPDPDPDSLLRHSASELVFQSLFCDFSGTNFGTGICRKISPCHPEALAPLWPQQWKTQSLS
jgi:hypothetical protein